MFRKNAYFKTPTVLQMEALECGAACLAMILGYYGKTFFLIHGIKIEIGRCASVMTEASQIKPEPIFCLGPLEEDHL